VNHKHFIRAEQLLGDDEGVQRVWIGAASGITYNMRLTFAKAEELSWIEPSIHAGENREVSGRRRQQITMGEGRGIARVGGE